MYHNMHFIAWTDDKCALSSLFALNFAGQNWHLILGRSPRYIVAWTDNKCAFMSAPLTNFAGQKQHLIPA